MKKWQLAAAWIVIFATLLTGCARIPVQSLFPTPSADIPAATDAVQATASPVKPQTGKGGADVPPEITAADYAYIEDPGVLVPYEPEPAKRANLAFSDMVFTAPDAQKTTFSLRALLCQFREAKSAAQQVAILREIDRLTSADADMVTLAGLQFSIDTTNPVYQEQQNQVQEYQAAISDVIFEVYAEVLQSEWIQDLTAYYGEDVIRGMQSYVDSFDREIYDLQKEIDALSDRYSTYMTQKRGELIPLAGTDQKFEEAALVSQLRFYGDDPEMAFLNKIVEQSLESYYAEMYEECNEIYSQIVALRTQQALLAGYGSYAEYACATDSGSYSYEDVLEMIRSVREHFVPIMQQLQDQGEAALNTPVTAATYYLAVCPAYYVMQEPDFSQEEILEIALDMVSATGAEAEELAEYMRQYDLLQVLSSPTKEAGAYSTYFNGYKQPAIFADRVDLSTIVHEMGHSLNSFLNPEPDIGERFSIGVESAEVHSMAMEMLCMEFYPDYYGESSDAAQAVQIYEALNTILTQTMFSEFEIMMYENPDMGPEGRANLYRRLQEEYGLASPGSPYLSDGRGWVQIHHFYSAPVYVQNYTLAQVVALDVREICREDWDEGVKRYYTYLRDQQELNFSRRLENAGLVDPLQPGALQSLAQSLSEYFAAGEYTQHYNLARYYYDEMMGRTTG